MQPLSIIFIIFHKQEVLRHEVLSGGGVTTVSNKHKLSEMLSGLN